MLCCLSCFDTVGLASWKAYVCGIVWDLQTFHKKGWKVVKEDLKVVVLVSHHVLCKCIPHALKNVMFAVSYRMTLVSFCKNWVVGCWHGCLSGVRCRFACGSANVIATHYLSRLMFFSVLPFWYRLTQVVSDKIHRAVNGCSSSSSRLFLTCLTGNCFVISRGKLIL